MAAFVVDVLSDVEGPLVAFGAEGTTVAVDLVGVGASGTVAGMASKRFHNVEFVIPRKTRVGRDRSEIHLANGVRHLGL